MNKVEAYDGLGCFLFHRLLLISGEVDLIKEQYDQMMLEMVSGAGVDGMRRKELDMRHERNRRRLLELRGQNDLIWEIRDVHEAFEKGGE